MNLYQLLVDRFLYATPTDFAIVAMSSIVVVWFFFNYCCD